MFFYLMIHYFKLKEEDKFKLIGLLSNNKSKVKFILFTIMFFEVESLYLNCLLNH